MGINLYIFDQNIRYIINNKFSQSSLYHILFSLFTFIFYIFFQMDKYMLFSEVYSSEEEKLANINTLQEKFENKSTSTILNGDESVELNESEESNKNYIIFKLKVGNIFENWDLAEKQVENYAIELGFEVVKRHIGKNKYDEILCRTFECKNSREYYAKKRADIENYHKRESTKMNYSWRVNFYLSDGIIHVTSMCKEYNHPLIRNI